MPVPEIDVDELAALRDDGAIVVDVREPDEYHECHVPGARLVPLASVPDEVDELPTDQPVYLICRTGRRSAHAAAFLIDQGIDAVNVAGGTVAWLAAGFDVVRDSSDALDDGGGQRDAANGSDDPEATS